MADDNKADGWMCPWGICNHAEAQLCRADTKPSRGCGGKFPEGTTYERARAEVTRPHFAPNPQGPRVGAAPVVPLTEERVRQIVREEISKARSD